MDGETRKELCEIAAALARHEDVLPRVVALQKLCTAKASHALPRSAQEQEYIQSAAVLQLVQDALGKGTSQGEHEARGLLVSLVE